MPSLSLGHFRIHFRSVSVVFVRPKFVCFLFVQIVFTMIAMAVVVSSFWYRLLVVFYERPIFLLYIPRRYLRGVSFAAVQRALVVLTLGSHTKVFGDLRLLLCASVQTVVRPQFSNHHGEIWQTNFPQLLCSDTECSPNAERIIATASGAVLLNWKANKMEFPKSRSSKSIAREYA